MPTPAIFAWPGARKNACWGAPQTRCTSGQSVQRCLLSAAPALPLLGLVPLVRVAEQTVDVPLDRHSLPHIRLGLAVLRIEGFFLFRQLPPLLFQRVHLWELRPILHPVFINAATLSKRKNLGLMSRIILILSTTKLFLTISLSDFL